MAGLMIYVFTSNEVTENIALGGQDLLGFIKNLAHKTLHTNIEYIPAQSIHR